MPGFECFQMLSITRSCAQSAMFFVGFLKGSHRLSSCRCCYDTVVGYRLASKLHATCSGSNSNRVFGCGHGQKILTCSSIFLSGDLNQFCKHKSAIYGCISKCVQQHQSHRNMTQPLFWVSKLRLSDSADDGTRREHFLYTCAT